MSLNDSRQLGKRHDPKQIFTTQSLHSSITAVAIDGATEIFPWHKFHNAAQATLCPRSCLTPSPINRRLSQMANFKFKSWTPPKPAPVLALPALAVNLTGH